MTAYEKVKERFQKENRMTVFEQAVEDACQKIMRQTDYDKETSLQKLKDHDLDIIKIIREWMGIPDKKEKTTTTNQMVFNEFRTFLDDAAKKYYKKKEMEERRNQIMQQAQLEMQRRAAAEKEVHQTLDVIKEVSDEQIISDNDTTNS